MTTELTILDRLKQHWLISIVIVCAAVAGTTWKLAHELLVSPREYSLSQLKEENAKLKEELTKLKTASPTTPVVEGSPTSGVTLALEQVGVFLNASATTADGRCSIRIDRISGEYVTISVTVDASAPIAFDRRKVGTRVPVDAGDRFYYIDLHRVRGDIVDLSVHVRKK